ncbi:MAG TPA: thiamine pyrophosphate-dependent enzyme [Spirochaetota bacterium]|nr:thiamine pyrophosphate-dependent enzyme [Spirochaetota bacterium]HNT12773.1 thiamine pyrophosphate-dependent enzyme [Spirochaetota bacterium]HNV45991.1 thiamine pyrophosphate-dependent enzyme [Spirochaetota bacterium]HPU89579.1 thiamine pyrophosphate-dependent enzyme [Spirochaetota bacterium]
MTVRIDDYRSAVENHWCPGCGNFGILEAVKKSLVQLDLPPEKVVVCTGIGQAPKLPHYLRVNTFNGLHGREVASATAIKCAAPDLTVLVHAGDGGAYGEGGNHFLHAIRRNIDITLVVHDNKVYGLTKGQASPMTTRGTKAKIHPHGVPSNALNPLALAIAQNCGFVAQCMSARGDHLAATLSAAIRHKGFSLVHVLQPCVSWDKVHTYAYYKEHCYELGADYDPGDRMKALELVLAEGDRLPLGILYRTEQPTFEDLALSHLDAPLRDLPVDSGRIERLMPKFQ